MIVISQTIIDNINNEILQIELVSVISDNPKAKGLQRAKREGIDTKIIDYSTYKNRREFDESLEIEILSINPDLIILAGYMKILNINFCNIFVGRILNIHPSLLPKYKGLNTHEKAIKNKDKFIINEFTFKCF